MKKMLVGLSLIVIVLLHCYGWPAAWEFIRTLAYAVYSFFVMLLPFLDIEQMVICKIVTILIVQLLCGAGFLISSKTESTIGNP